MKALPPYLVRPALLSEVQPPGILLQIEKHGAPFLVVGEGDEIDVVCLGGQYQFRTFKRSTAESWSGLAIEGVEFEVNTDTAVDVMGFRRIPGIFIRKGKLLTIVAISDNNFRQVVEIPIEKDLPEGSAGREVAFTECRAFVTVGKERRPVWEFSVPMEQDSVRV